MGITERLAILSTFYHREALKCSRGRAYFSACIMEVASLEASLQGMCSLHLKDIKKTSIYQRKRFRAEDETES